MSSTIPTLTEVIKEDHTEIYKCYEQYENSKDNQDVQARLARQLTWQIAMHAVAEELVVYPLMERYLGEDGLYMASHDRAQHQNVKELLYNLESMALSTAGYDAALSKVMDHLHRHNDEEEVKDLPRLEPALGGAGGDVTQNAAALFSRTKKFVSTSAYATSTALMAAPIDKLQEIFNKFPAEERKEEV